MRNLLKVLLSIFALVIFSFGSAGSVQAEVVLGNHKIFAFGEGRDESFKSFIEGAVYDNFSEVKMTGFISREQIASLVFLYAQNTGKLENLPPELKNLAEYSAKFLSLVNFKEYYTLDEFRLLGLQGGILYLVENQASNEELARVSQTGNPAALLDGATAEATPVVLNRETSPVVSPTIKVVANKASTEYVSTSLVSDEEIDEFVSGIKNTNEKANRHEEELRRLKAEIAKNKAKNNADKIKNVTLEKRIALLEKSLAAQRAEAGRHSDTIPLLNNRMRNVEGMSAGNHETAKLLLKAVTRVKDGMSDMEEKVEKSEKLSRLVLRTILVTGILAILVFFINALFFRRKNKDD